LEDALRADLYKLRSEFADLLAGYKIIPSKHGVDELRDLRRLLPKQAFSVIFDVGANQGDVAAAFRREFPSATIYCFEPNTRLVTSLRRRDPRFKVHSIALSSRVGVAGFDTSAATPDLYGLTEDPAAASVPLDTIDNFCADHCIERISYLKIDTEGHDLEVIRGAHGLLEHERIDALQAEVSMSPDNTRHVGFFQISSHLENYGYRLFGLYEQMHEWPTRRPNLRRANAIYISRQVINSNSVEHQ
jgi:FkbM family methyltransferase